jgi:RHS repeat-associated protein
VEAPSISGYGWLTTYVYDALNDLTNVTQNGSNSSNARVRNFGYDSLTRLTSAANPESGTISYTYDANGNVLNRAAPQPNQTGTAQTTTTYGYDVLNRRLSITHTNPSGSNAAYAYDGTAISGCPGVAVPSITSPTNLIGQRSAMCTQQSASGFSYDPMGRIALEARTNSYQNPAPVTYTTGYQYWLNGSLETLTYPSGDVLTYVVGGADRPLGVSDASNTYVASGTTNHATYAPQGAVAGMTNGYSSTFAGIVTSNTYNDRLQPILISASAPSNDIYSLCYDFHLSQGVTSGPCSLTAYSTGNNGNVFRVLNNVDSTRSAVFTYDSLNRITQGNTVNTTSANCWGEAYTIDAWGNLTNTNPAPDMSGSCFYEPLSAAPASTANQLGGYCYDAAGNLLQSGTCPSGSFTPTYYYDQENRLYNPSAPYTYFYDADGLRARKAASATVGTFYWRGPNGETLTEANGSGTIDEDYIYFNGSRIARVDRPSGTVHYYFSDHLGSASVVTSATGGGATYDYYYPYGGLAGSTGSDPNHYLFTGKERDNESGEFGLDYFGARHYASMAGRFMTPDWSSTPTPVPYASVYDPQTLNLYSYVQNNPLRYYDPDGHCWSWATFFCDVGQRFDNLVHGEGFHTDSQVENILHRDNMFLRQNGVNPEGMTHRQVMKAYDNLQPRNQSPTQPVVGAAITLRLIHRPETIQNNPEYPSIQKMTNEEIIQSLKSGKEPILVEPDGRVMNGNTRLYVLQERGVDINSLGLQPQQLGPEKTFGEQIEENMRNAPRPTGEGDEMGGDPD